MTRTLPAEDALDRPVDPTTPRRRGVRRFVPRTRRGRVIAAVAALLVVALGAAALWLLFRPVETRTTRQVVTASATTLKQTVSATGTLNPQRQANLTFPAAGKVTSVAVKVGDAVTAGQALASIDDASLRVARQAASADLSAAQANLSTLLGSTTSTSAAITAARATVQVKQNALTQARANLEDATLKAPFDGVVAAVNVAPGDATGGATATGASGSAATAASSSATAAIVVITHGQFTVATSVSNSDVASIKPGLQAVVTPTGSATPVYGTVSTVGVMASASGGTSGTTSGGSSSSGASGSTTFPVTVAVTGSHPELLAGSSVAVQLVTAQYTDVVAVPTLALTTANGTSTLTKVVNGVDTPTSVTTGAVVGNQTIITAGLTEGDQYVVQATRAAGQAGQGGAGSTNRQAGQGQFPQGGFPQGGQGGQQGGRG